MASSYQQISPVELEVGYDQPIESTHPRADKLKSKTATILAVIAAFLLLGVVALCVPRPRNSSSSNLAAVDDNQLQLLGSKHKKKTDDDEKTIATICENPNYSSTTLKTAYEMAFIGLLKVYILLISKRCIMSNDII